MSAVMTIVVWSSFFVLVVGCLAVGFAQMRPSHGPAILEKEAVALLRRRLASGKIDDEEYVRRLFDLQGR
jgi:uncharacterized membrane protein